MRELFECFSYWLLLLVVVQVFFKSNAFFKKMELLFCYSFKTRGFVQLHWNACEIVIRKKTRFVVLLVVLLPKTSRQVRCFKAFSDSKLVEIKCDFLADFFLEKKKTVWIFNIFQQLSFQGFYAFQHSVRGVI